MVEIMMREAIKGDYNTFCGFDEETVKKANEIARSLITNLFPDKEIPDDLDEIDVYTRDGFNKPQGVILSLDGKIHLMIYYATYLGDEHPGAVEITSVYSRTNIWAKNYGSLLLNYLIIELKKAHYAEVRVWIMINNKKGRKFYEDVGFTPTDEIRNDTMLYIHKL